MKVSGLILGADGRPAKIAARYEAAHRSGARSNISAPARSSTRDTQEFTRKRLLELSRYFYKNSPFYVGIIERLVSYVVGTGHSVRPKSSSGEFNAAAADYWAMWCEDSGYGAPMNFLTYQNIIARAQFVDGDIGSLLTSRGGMPAVQLIESHLICDRSNSDWDKPDGVNLDRTGRVLSYSIARDDDLREFSKYAEKDLVVHLFPTRANQYRGVPVATSALLTIHDLDDILALEKQAVKTFSSRTHVIKNTAGEADDDGIPSAFSAAQSAAEGDEEERQKHFEELATRAHAFYLRPNEEYQTLSNDRPGPAWQGFVAFLTECMCHSTGFPVSLILGTKVGGADTRRELATAERAIAHWQNRLCWQLQRVYRYVISFGIRTGAITAGIPDDWDALHWQHPPRATVDSGRDASTDRALVAAGLMTREEYFAKNGKDWREASEQLAIEAAYMATLAEKYKVNPAAMGESFETAQTAPQTV